MLVSGKFKKKTLILKNSKFPQDRVQANSPVAMQFSSESTSSSLVSFRRQSVISFKEKHWFSFQICLCNLFFKLHKRKYMLRDRDRIVNFLFLCFLLLNFLSSHHCSAISNITSSNPLLQGQTLSSPNQDFELGFFSPNNSQNQYMGIWYKNAFPRTVVWVANRDKPVVISVASLQIGNDGNLRLVDGKQDVLWSTSIGASNGSVAVLLNNGSFIMKDRTSGENLWDNFNHSSSDTMIPGTRLLLNFKTGERVVTTSWKSENDPSPGSFIFGFRPELPPQVFIWRGSTPYWRSGLWDKSMFLGIPDMDSTYRSSFSVGEDVNQGTVSFSISTFKSCQFSNFVLSPTGSLKLMCWERGKNWYSIWQAPENGCEIYGACGPFGFCESSQPLLTCRCLKGFVPKSQKEWSRGNWTEGCVRRAKLFCEKNTSTTQAQAQRGKEDVFWKISGMKLPDFSENVQAYREIGCSQWCLNNCSCLAYAYVHGIGCLVWTNDFIDVLEFSSGGQDLYLRLAHVELDDKGEDQKRLTLIISLTACSSVTIFIFSVIAYCLNKRRVNQKLNKIIAIDSSKHALKQSKWRSHIEEQDPLELPMFDLDSILEATNNFNATYKLGQGGYGPVYKGKLQDGKDVAIKRLASSSGQGIEEFKNEIMLISKLQHRNLVKIIGCCIESEEKILIYEFMPNKSLDTFLFDPTKNAQLDWPKRFNIILGVARGILYLHRDSCLRIIHRDLKVSNILLDEKMNPKISDFGLARIFQGTHDLANTRRVVGTLGYMSPEYVLGGIFSEKSDVFSFGVLLLEIVCGKKISSFYYEEEPLGLIAYAWRSWCASGILNIVDKALTDSFSSSEVIRCVNIGLLCVQDHASDRPTMPAIVSMLMGEAKLPHPKEPTFTFQSTLNYHAQSQNHSVCSINKVTESIVEGR